MCAGVVVVVMVMPRHLCKRLYVRESIFGSLVERGREGGRTELRPVDMTVECSDSSMLFAYTREGETGMR